MSRRLLRKWTATGLLAALTILAGAAVLHPSYAFAQEELSRKVKLRVAPTYPDLARRMNITGVVKVAVVVSPNGTLKSTKIVGGHPVLAAAALDALRKWKFETAPEDSAGLVEFKFESQP